MEAGPGICGALGQGAGLAWLHLSVFWSVGCVVSPVHGRKLPLKGRVGAASVQED